jgi:hypothetical protein
MSAPFLLTCCSFICGYQAIMQQHRFLVLSLCSDIEGRDSALLLSLSPELVTLRQLVGLAVLKYCFSQLSLVHPCCPQEDTIEACCWGPVARGLHKLICSFLPSGWLFTSRGLIFHYTFCFFIFWDRSYFATHLVSASQAHVTSALSAVFMDSS